MLNEQDILEYILSRYNVTLRVTTLEEPLLEARGGGQAFLHCWLLLEWLTSLCGPQS